MKITSNAPHFLGGEVSHGRHVALRHHHQGGARRTGLVNAAHRAVHGLQRAGWGRLVDIVIQPGSLRAAARAVRLQGGGGAGLGWNGRSVIISAPHSELGSGERQVHPSQTAPASQAAQTFDRIRHGVCVVVARLHAQQHLVRGGLLAAAEPRLEGLCGVRGAALCPAGLSYNQKIKKRQFKPVSQRTLLPLSHLWMRAPAVYTDPQLFLVGITILCKPSDKAQRQQNIAALPRSRGRAPRAPSGRACSAAPCSPTRVEARPLRCRDAP